MNIKSSKSSIGRENVKAKSLQISIVQELQVDVDLRRLHEACSQLGDEIAPFLKRIKTELYRLKEGEQTDIPQIPLFVHDKISLRDARLLFTVALPPYPYLRVIQLHHCELTDNGLLFLSEFLKAYRPILGKNPFGIECLELPGCGIGPRGAHHLASVLCENTTIKRLVLDFNPLTDEGTKLLCEGIHWNAHLKELSMQYCGLGPAGASYVSSFVIKCSNVQVLSLRGNHIHEEGVLDIARSIAVSMKLEELDLADVAFGAAAESIEALCEGIENSTSLRSINLDLNTLSTNGPGLLLEAIRKNVRITNLVINERTDPEVYKEVLRSLEANRKCKEKKKKTHKR